MGLEPTTPTVTGWCSNLLSYGAIRRVQAHSFPIPALSAPPRGLEPRTLELTALCSAIELRRNSYYLFVAAATIVATDVVNPTINGLASVKVIANESCSPCDAVLTDFSLELV